METCGSLGRREQKQSNFYISKALYSITVKAFMLKKSGHKQGQEEEAVGYDRVVGQRIASDSLHRKGEMAD